MLEYFFRAPHRLRELRSNPLGDQIVAFAEKLRRVGFTRASGGRILNNIGKFNDFARSVGVEKAEGIDEGLIQRFFKKELPARGSFREAPAIMRHVTEHLRDLRCTSPSRVDGIGRSVRSDSQPIRQPS